MSARNEQTVFSRHATSEGIVTFVRDSKGTVQVCLHRHPQRAERVDDGARRHRAARDGRDRQACA